MRGLRVSPVRSLCLCVLLVGLVNAQVPSSPRPDDRGPLPGNWIGSGPLHKVVISMDRPDLFEVLLQAKAVVEIEDYGAFAVVRVDARRIGGPDQIRSAGLPVRDELDLMAINGFHLNGARPLETLLAMPPVELLGDPLKTALEPTAGLYLVQFRGPVKDTWRAALDATGVRVIGFVPSNAYLVHALPGQVAALEEFGAQEDAVQFVGVYQPGFKLRPSLRRLARRGEALRVPVVVQVAQVAGSRDAVDFVARRMASLDTVRAVGPYLNVQGSVDVGVLYDLARHSSVVAIEPGSVRSKFDERQGQIIAGNISGSGPTGPGYLAWLASKGFGSGQFGSFSINVVDDAPSLTGHPDIPNSRVDFALNPSGQSASQAGHGFLNAHIIAGYNDLAGFPYEDGLGYNYGLGIAPWAHVGCTAIFGSGGASATSYESDAYNAGARISSNSWGYQTFQGSPIPSYDSNAQEMDFIVRDARGSQSGNQQYSIVFSAANSGSSSNTVTTPATAKNVITVGASENQRQDGSDGCGIGNSGANDINDIIGFSSRGPTDDGRWKPEIVAPGTHIVAGIPQTNYVGGGVCNNYFPSGQTLYGWSSGTSHSAPAVAGGAALVHQWFLNNGLAAPSPAMGKAVIVASAEYLTGVGANDTLPSQSQGMGLMNLGRGFDGVSRVLEDQTTILGTTGSSHVVSGQIDNAGKPFRVTLVWTDAPGTSSSAAWVNDLDLTVTAGGVTYRGNVFSGAFSTSGGSADFRNNTESVFLPAGASGSFTVTVTASNIAGDGVPGNGDSTDQDFALVIWNGTTTVLPPDSAPTNLNGSASTPTQVDLDWTDTSTNEASFVIERSTDGANFVEHDSVGANVTAYADTTVVADTDYWYRVFARNSAGDSAATNTVSVTTPAGTQTDYVATSDVGGNGSSSGSYTATHALDGSVQAITERLSGGKPSNRHSYLNRTWTFSVSPADSLTFNATVWRSSGGSPQDNFQFAYSTDNATYFDIGSPVASSSPSTSVSAALPNNLGGTVFIRVTDTDQSSGEQNLNTVSIDHMYIRAVSGGGGTFPPAAPSGLSATATSSSSIDLSWSDNSGDETAFRVERSTAGSGGPFSAIATLPANTTAYTDAGLTSSTEYWYRVIAVHTLESSPSNVASATTFGVGGTDDVATGESSVQGSVTGGSYLDTQAAGGGVETLRERKRGGGNNVRSLLEHHWNFNVSGGATSTFQATAWKVASGDDDFVFSYSVDGGSSWTAMSSTLITSTSPQTVTYDLTGVSGAVIIRVKDTVSTGGNPSLDEISIDHLVVINN